MVLNATYCRQNFNTRSRNYFIRYSTNRQLGEEAQEAKNKDFKFLRENKSRKDSAEHTNIDLLQYLLLSSDPIISSLPLSRR
jgi:hypothetical protein